MGVVVSRTMLLADVVMYFWHLKEIKDAHLFRVETRRSVLCSPQISDEDRHEPLNFAPICCATGRTEKVLELLADSEIDKKQFLSVSKQA